MLYTTHTTFPTRVHWRGDGRGEWAGNDPPCAARCAHDVSPACASNSTRFDGRWKTHLGDDSRTVGGSRDMTPLATRSCVQDVGALTPPASVTNSRQQAVASDSVSAAGAPTVGRMVAKATCDSTRRATTTPIMTLRHGALPAPAPAPAPCIWLTVTHRAFVRGVQGAMRHRIIKNLASLRDLVDKPTRTASVRP